MHLTDCSRNSRTSVPPADAVDRDSPPSLLISAYRTCESLPLVGGLFTRGRHEAEALVSLVVAAVADELDIDRLVRERVTAETVDAMIARVDLVALANKVIDGVDLRALIRQEARPVPVEVRGLRQRFRDRS